MRDLDQLRERGEPATGRKLGLVALASVLSVTAALAMGLMVQGADPQSAMHPEPDLLAQLALSGASTQAEANVATPSPHTVKPESLSFPATLLDREEAILEATVRAAEAEHARLARGSTGSRAYDDRPIPSVSDVPAANFAVSDSARLARVAKHDPMVAEALPRNHAENAEVGHEGSYTLQVVSYEDRTEAETFASNLRARGHRAFVLQADVPDRGRFYRVRVGPFLGRKEARNYQDQFERNEQIRTIVVSNKEK